MTTLTLISFFLLFGFIGISIRKHTLLPSYSAYASKWWIDKVQNLNVWQVVTLLAAFLLMPPMIERGVGSALQFLGFFCPLYLIVVAFTPRWEESKKEHIIHSVGAGICAICAILWMALVCKVWYILLPVAAFVLILAYATNSLKSAITFWLEMVMFLASYVTVLFF